MALVPLRVVLDHAAENDYGVAAFNVNNMEQIQAIMEAADETDSPVIVQASRGARKYSQDAYLRHLMLAAVELYPQIPIVMHQDHGNSPDTCQSAIDNGFTSVMMDGSLKDDGKTPADYDYNVQVTKQVVRNGPCAGCLGRRRTGLPRFAGNRRRREGRRPRRRRRADARPTADRSGRSRAISSPRRASTRWPSPSAPATAPTSSPASPTAKCWRWTASKRFTSGCRTCHLVMHGSSSVPQELQDIINKYGGKIKQTWGVPVEEIQRGIKHGVRKINVDTDNRLAITGAIRKVLCRVAREVRSPRLPEAGPRRDEASLHRPHDGLRPGRECRVATKEAVAEVVRLLAFARYRTAPELSRVRLHILANASG